MRMTRDEVRKAIEFKKPNGVPIKTEDIAGETKAKYGKALDDILERYPNDFLVVCYEGLGADKTGMDCWGCQWGRIEGTTGEQVIGHSLDDWDNLKTYKFPDPNLPGRFEKAKGEIEKGGNIYTIGLALITLFEQLHFLRGYSNLLEDLYQERKKVDFLIERIMEFNMGIINNWAKSGADCVMLSDDWGTQESLMIHPKMWREIFKPRYKKIIDFAHNKNLHVFFHSCGNITEIVPDLIECGVDILNPIQPNAIDVREVGKRFAGKVCFAGAIDTQQTLLYGTPEDVQREVTERIRTLGTEDGGYICCSATTLMPDIPLENIEAMLNAAKEYRYPPREADKI